MRRLPRQLPLLLLFLPVAAAAAEEGSAPKVEFGEQLAQVMGGLALVLVLVVVLAWLARRLNQSRFTGAGRLRLVGGISLGARERIVVVEVDDVQLVVGVAPGRVQTLHVLDRPLQEQVPDEADGEGFPGRLARLMGKEEKQ